MSRRDLGARTLDECTSRQCATTEGDVMERYEIKSRVDAKLAEGKRTLDHMRAKVNASEHDATATYHERVTELAHEHSELEVKASQAFESADDAFDRVVDSIECALDEWAERASRVRDDILP